MDRERLKELEIMVNTPANISPKEYWDRINVISEKEQKAFAEESKKIAIPERIIKSIFLNQ